MREMLRWSGCQASGEGAPAAPVTVACELLLPCSAFPQPTNITPDEFHSILANSVRFQTPPPPSFDPHPMHSLCPPSPHALFGC